MANDGFYDLRGRAGQVFLPVGACNLIAAVGDELAQFLDVRAFLRVRAYVEYLADRPVFPHLDPDLGFRNLRRKVGRPFGDRIALAFGFYTRNVVSC